MLLPSCSPTFVLHLRSLALHRPGCPTEHKPFPHYIIFSAMNSFLKYMLFGNTVQAWLIATGITMLLLLVIHIIKIKALQKISAHAARTKNNLDDFIALQLKKTGIPFLYIMSIYAGFSVLSFNDIVNKWTKVIFLVSVTFLVLRLVTGSVNWFITMHAGGNENSTDAKPRQVRGIVTILNIVVWITGIIFLMGNLGFNISSIVAGLGIGGIAVALAAQTILGDLFSYFVIFFDKPFETGDFIIVDDKMGTIEYIGIKTTRVRTLGGEQLIFSNQDLTSARVHNYKRMERRRIVFTLGIIYETPAAVIKRLPELVKKIIDKQQGIIFDRGHFSSFGDFSLQFEFVYFILSSDYNMYMDRQQAIYQEIFTVFEQEGIEFAYPTRKIIMENIKAMEQDA